MAELPILSERPLLHIDHFPTLAQCFIFRNWEMLTPARLARVLACDEETVREMAADMGLPPATDEARERLWLDRGYITLIRQNWHLLPYSQLCVLLDWDEERLAFILHEDDFLEHKLGRQKPNCAPLSVTSLSKEQKERTAAIKKIVSKTYATLGERKLPPFAFEAVYPKAEDNPPIEGGSRFKSSFCCSYCGLYGDVFLEERLIEASFPDELLRSYQAMGVGGVWTQAVLYTLVPNPYDPSLSEGWEQRIRGLNAVIARLKKYGLKLYLYINEPREMTEKFFEKRPDLKGDVYNPGYASICLSVPEAQDYLRESVRFLTEHAPGLGGYLTITASENHTHCYSHRATTGSTTCLRCKEKGRSDLIALANRLVWEGATAADPNVQVIAYSWAWDREPNGFYETVKRLPREIAVLGVSERGAPKSFDNVTVEVSDYSISVCGPSKETKERYKFVKENKNASAIKVQLNNSWELCPVPYIPVFGHFYQSIRDLCETVDPDILMMTWTHGGFPSPVFRMVAEMTRKGQPIPPKEKLIEALYPEADQSLLLEAFDVFDDAFNEYPFSVGTMYNGPQHMGPALPFYPKETGWTTCMVGPPYDHLDGWRSNHYTRELYGRQLGLLSAKWKKGLPILERAFEGKELSPAARLLLDCAEVTYLHFASSYNHVLHVEGRDSGKTSAEMAALIKEDEAFALREAALMQRNPTIGYESSNHYLYTVTDMVEKILNCRYLLEGE